jgi:chemotaxis protein methyltransferase WspC
LGQRSAAQAPDVARPTANDASPFQLARQLADNGNLGLAQQLCLQALAQCGPSADGYALLGIIQQSLQEDAEAQLNLQRALYLEPNHAEALLHLALLHDRQGDHAKARLLRTRLSRLHKRDNP